MNSENDNEKNEGSDEKFERTLNHLKSGYSNAQDVIRFVDTKTGWLTGIATLTMGFILEAARQYAEMPSDMKRNFSPHPYLSCVLTTVGQYALLAGGLCLWCCVFSLVARPPVKKTKHDCTVLFPFYVGTPRELEFVSRATQGLSRKQILNEYEAQIWNIGLILHKKVVRHRWGVKIFLVQLMLLALGGVLILLCLQN